jgi:hypothetical protein
LPWIPDAPLALSLPEFVAVLLHACYYRLFRRVSLCLSSQVGSSVEMLARARPLDIKGVGGPLSEH